MPFLTKLAGASFHVVDIIKFVIAAWLVTFVCDLPDLEDVVLSA